jgi:hypothetical protein
MSRAKLERHAGDGYIWQYVKAWSIECRLATRAEATCGCVLRGNVTCREPAAIITAFGDAYCARHFGTKHTAKLRRKIEDGWVSNSTDGTCE